MGRAVAIRRWHGGAAADSGGLVGRQPTAACRQNMKEEKQRGLPPRRKRSRTETRVVVVTVGKQQPPAFVGQPATSTERERRAAGEEWGSDRGYTKEKQGRGE